MSNELGNTPADKDYKPSGMTKAQEAAQKAFPGQMFIHDRCVFRMGYEAAEKDIALTWEDMRKIIRIDEAMMDDMEAHPEWWEEQPFYEEMLRRFNQFKKKQQ